MLDTIQPSKPITCWPRPLQAGCSPSMLLRPKHGAVAENFAWCLLPTGTNSRWLFATSTVTMTGTPAPMRTSVRLVSGTLPTAPCLAPSWREACWATPGQPASCAVAPFYRDNFEMTCIILNNQTRLTGLPGGDLQVNAPAGGATLPGSTTPPPSVWT